MIAQKSVLCPLSAVLCLLTAGCGYTTRPGLAGHLKTIYVKPFANRVDITRASTSTERFPIYRHRMEVDLTNAILDRLQITGTLRPSPPEKADTRLEGEVVEFRRDALRYDQNSQVEEWRLNLVVDLRFYDQTANTLMWDETRLTGDTTYFTATDSEAGGLDRAITDLARRIVERIVENW